MSKGRSLYQEIVKNFFESLTLRKKKVNSIGEDYLGNRYYEIPFHQARGSLRKSSRWFEPKEGAYGVKDLPVEWRAWLSHTRNDPPTKEEIEYNFLKMKQTVQNAEKLNQSFAVKVDEKKNVKHTFPVYEEYESVPGLKRDK